MIFYYNKIAGARVTRRGLEDERSNSDRIKVTYLYNNIIIRTFIYECICI